MNNTNDIQIVPLNHFFEVLCQFFFFDWVFISIVAHIIRIELVIKRILKLFLKHILNTFAS
jgi:hypothetical protein